MPADRAPLPADIPPEAVPFLERMGYLLPDALARGDAAPNVPLWDEQGALRRSPELWAGRSAVLIFGSFT